MITYKRVDEAPEKLKKGEYVVKRPDFLEFVVKAKGRNRDNNVTSLSGLRNVFIEIGNVYSENFSAYTHVNLANFVGVGYKNNKELAKIVNKIVMQQAPGIVDKLIDDQIKKMPSSTERVFFVAEDLKDTGVLGHHHIRLEQEKKEIKETKKTTKSKDKK